VFSPPHPVKKFFYRCDKKFHLEDLLQLYTNVETHAIVLISGKRTEYYEYSKNETKFLSAIDATLPNQHKTGGSSASRFGRIRDDKINLYAKKIIESMIRLYIKNNIFQCKGLIIAGPSSMKKIVMDLDLFDQHFARHLLKNLTTTEIVSDSIRQVILMAADVLTTDATEKNIINDFEEKIKNTSTIDLIIFGTSNVISELLTSNLKEIYVADDYDDKETVLTSNTKTIIHLIKSKEFTSKYGELVGIKYY